MTRGRYDPYNINSITDDLFPTFVANKLLCNDGTDLFWTTGLDWNETNDCATITGTAGKQLRLAYDGSNYADLLANSAGNLIITPSGSTYSQFTFTDLIFNYIHAGTSGWGAELNFQRAKGSLAIPTQVLDDDHLGALTFDGYDGTRYVNAAVIVADVDGTPGEDNIPGRLDFYTRPDGDDIALRLRIDNAGDFDFQSGDITTVGNISGANITATGLDVDNIDINGNNITSNTGSIGFNDDNLITTGTGSFGSSTNSTAGIVHAQGTAAPVLRGTRWQAADNFWTIFGCEARQTGDAGDGYGAGLSTLITDSGGTFTLGVLGFVRDGGNRKGKFVAQSNNGNGADSWVWNLQVQPDGDIYLGTAAQGSLPTNYIQISGAGDMTFNGTAGFYPVRLSTAVGDEPSPDTGELIIWHDETNNKVYLKYNDTTEGDVKVEMT